ncbi:NUDIX hydrolase [Streptomyces caatingaensis]|uniref:Nudix hydrolase domain-containing protein n=1 Tax=Streptomyces caatingaensis TaxID=1678637 RepID=A0A0K9XDD5_9ACTN|nr:NUDIX hydrolase [Streptomyces caatingaensis]KNB51434.1 hypothetical protein AC230_13645 [Streptomyces caatingaensis]
MTAVLAAGCVLWRRCPGPGEAAVEVAVVHRPKYDDWSLPKGKLKRGEPAEAGAVREVLEETGMTCRLGPFLATVRYVLADGRTKEVRYWAAEATGGTFVPNREVDAVRWLPPRAARGLLTQERDVQLVAALVGVLGEG